MTLSHSQVELSEHKPKFALTKIKWLCTLIGESITQSNINLFFQLWILYAQLLFIKVWIFSTRKTTTRRAYYIPQGLSDCNVFTSNLIIFRTKCTVICSLMLRLIDRIKYQETYYVYANIYNEPKQINKNKDSQINKNLHLGSPVLKPKLNLTRG